MTDIVLLGDEAIAMGAIHGGVSVAYGYPGTPSTEIITFIQSHREKQQTGPKGFWVSNEKTAYEEALGASMVGKRSLITMKHVGLNVAADPFMNSALLDIQGGIVLAIADDPSMHASQNEQDSRFYADFAKIICLEPSNQQEAYDMTKEAFLLSEKYHTPVMIRLVTRLAHSRAVVTLGASAPENPLRKAPDRKGWMTLPALARKRYAERIETQKYFTELSDSSSHNPLKLNETFSDFGVITTGLAKNYLLENQREMTHAPSHLHISHYPLPIEKIRSLASTVKKLIVLEEGYPFVERFLRGILDTNIDIVGKMDSLVPASGELNPDNIRTSLGLPEKTNVQTSDMPLPNRPPQLCKGCPHIDSFTLIKEAVSGYDESIVTSDIGCYSLGALPPYDAIDSLVCMGASIGMAKGAAEAGFFPVIATIGDSTFFHTGISPLIDAVANNVNMTLVILDNSITAMTGGQEVVMSSDNLFSLIRGIGVPAEHIKVITALKSHHAENLDILKTEIAYNGVSVILSRRPCLKIKKGG